MILFKKTADIRKWLDDQSLKDKLVGFVPTMGALHNGHLSLINASKKNAEITVCSIFVNPAQFNDQKDFEKYPITLEQDICMLENAGCDLLFLPSVTEVYPEGVPPLRYDLGKLEEIFEGAFRPGHFQGVCMVVHRLLEIIRPDQLFLGQKDYQQCMVIGKLIALTGMKDAIRVIVCPTLREEDGLAMSSRNLRLSAHERALSPLIFNSLSYVKEHLKPGSVAELKSEALKMLVAAGLKPDYLEIADVTSLDPVELWDGHQKLILLCAVWINEIRLIDNMIVN